MRYLTTEPIERNALLEHGGPSHGARVTFSGIVRPDRHEHRTVTALFYDAHVAMAERQIERLIRVAQATWRVDSLIVRHRLGLVPVGQIGLFVTVAACHRREAFMASQGLIDGIKTDVPIWKCVHYDDGTRSWNDGIQTLDAPHQESVLLAC